MKRMKAKRNPIGTEPVAGRRIGDPESVGTEPPDVTYVVGTYPLLTTTFIDREIKLLRSWSAAVDVISLRQPRPGLSPEQLPLVETTKYARPADPIELTRRHLRYLGRRPLRYLGTFTRLVTGRGQTFRQRARTAGHFVLGVHVTGLIEESGSTRRIHAHFIDRAATVAHVAAQLLDVPYSITAHASDIYLSPVLLDVKMTGADFVATCTGYNREHLAQLVPAASDRLILNHHGLEIDRYTPSTTQAAGAGEAPRLVSVGQLEERKGFVHLLDACRTLRDRGVAFHLEIIGSGTQQTELEDRIDELGIEDVVTLRGAVPHDAVVTAYSEASMFVLPCVLGEDGDRDGIPNVILEAMAMALPVVSTLHSGIPEAVESEVTGILVPPRDADALAAAVERLLADPTTARQMGVRGRQVVTERFDVERNVRTMYQRLIGDGG